MDDTYNPLLDSSRIYPHRSINHTKTNKSTPQKTTNHPSNNNK